MVVQQMAEASHPEIFVLCIRSHLGTIGNTNNFRGDGYLDESAYVLISQKVIRLMSKNGKKFLT